MSWSTLEWLCGACHGDRARPACELTCSIGGKKRWRSGQLRHLTFEDRSKVTRFRSLAGRCQSWQWAGWRFFQCFSQETCPFSQTVCEASSAPGVSVLWLWCVTGSACLHLPAVYRTELSRPLCPLSRKTLLSAATRWHWPQRYSGTCVF